MDAGQKQTQKILDSMEEEIAVLYSKAAKKVQKELDEYLRKFEAEDRKKREQVENDEITEAEYVHWRTGKIMTGKQWSEKETDLANGFVITNVAAAAIINKHTPEAYAVGRNYAVYEIEKGALLSTSFELYDKFTVERLSLDNPDLLPKAKVKIPKDLKWNKQKINSCVLRGIVQGDDIPTISERLQSVSDMNKSSAIRNARTMTTSAENGGRLDSYIWAEKIGITVEKQWLATLDGRTRHSHAAQDGEHIPIHEEFSNGLMFPGDPDGEPGEVYNCRCTMVAVVEETDPTVNPDAVYRNSRLGDMDYDEWLEEHMEEL